MATPPKTLPPDFFDGAPKELPADFFEGDKKDVLAHKLEALKANVAKYPKNEEPANTPLTGLREAALKVAEGLGAGHSTSVGQTAKDLITAPVKMVADLYDRGSAAAPDQFPELTTVRDPGQVILGAIQGGVGMLQDSANAGTARAKEAYQQAKEEAAKGNFVKAVLKGGKAYSRLVSAGVPLVGTLAETGAENLGEGLGTRDFNKAGEGLGDLANAYLQKEIIGAVPKELPFLRRKKLEFEGPSVESKVGTTPDQLTQPTFTTDGSGGANYDSAKLAEFKAANGIKDEPVQMVGDAIVSEKGTLPFLRKEGSVAPDAAPAPSGELPKYAGSINLEKINGPDELKQTILGEYERNQKATDAQRRGVQSHEDTKKLAAQLGMSPESLAKTQKGKAFNAEQITRAREINATTANAVMEARKKYQTSQDPKDLLAVQEALTRHAAVQMALEGASTEAGRALNAHKILVEAKKLAETNSEKALQRVREALGDDWEAKQQEVIKKLAQIPDDDIVSMNKLLRNYTKFSSIDKIQAYWTANVLSGIGTNVVNFAGNVGFVPAELAVKGARAGIDSVVSALTGKQRDFYFREVPASIQGRFQGINDGFKAAMTILKDGMDTSTLEKMDLPTHYEFPGGFKNPWNVPGRLLGASDAIFKAMALKGELYSQAAKIAKSEGLKGEAFTKRANELIQNPTPEMVETAAKQSKFETFQSDLGKVGQAAQRFLNVPYESLGGVKANKFILPFFKTPVNLLKRGLELTPAGAIKATAEGLKGNRAAAIDGAARASIGSAVMLYALGEAMKGNLTGKAPTDKNERDAFFRQNKQEFSVKIGNRWVRYTDFGALAIPFLATSASYDAYRKNKQMPKDEVLSETMASLGNGVVNQSFLRGLMNMTEAFSGRQGALSSYASGVASGFVPLSGLLRSARGVKDDTLRDPDGIYEKLKNGIPILSEDIAPRVSAFGKEQKVSPLNAIFRLGLQKDEGTSPLEQELSRLEIAPGKVGETFQLKNKQYKLSKEQQADYQRMVGPKLESELNRVMNTEQYKRVDDERKKDLLEEAINKVRRQGREEFAKSAGKLEAKPKKNKFIFARSE